MGNAAARSTITFSSATAVGRDGLEVDRPLREPGSFRAEVQASEHRPGLALSAEFHSRAYARKRRAVLRSARQASQGRESMSEWSRKRSPEATLRTLR
jgi:hypothetical protein